MKTYFIKIFLGILLLAACTPTPTSTPVDLPSADTETATPLPQVEGPIVTNASDSGPGSLRQAIEDARSPTIRSPSIRLSFRPMRRLPSLLPARNFLVFMQTT